MSELEKWKKWTIPKSITFWNGLTEEEKDDIILFISCLTLTPPPDTEGWIKEYMTLFE